MSLNTQSECEVIHGPNWLEAFVREGFRQVKTYYRQVTQSWRCNFPWSISLFNIENQFPEIGAPSGGTTPAGGERGVKQHCSNNKNGSLPASSFLPISIPINSSNPTSALGVQKFGIFKRTRGTCDASICKRLTAPAVCIDLTVLLHKSRPLPAGLTNSPLNAVSKIGQFWKLVAKGTSAISLLARKLPRYFLRR